MCPVPADVVDDDEACGICGTDVDLVLVRASPDWWICASCAVEILLRFEPDEESP
jgi:hypothetical protein